MNERVGIEQPLNSRKQRRRHWLLAGCLVLLLAAGTAIYSWQRPSPPVPPRIDPASIDPLAAEAIENARAEVEKAPRSADAWGKLAMIFMAQEFLDESVFCFGQAAQLAPEEPRWPYLHGYTIARTEPEAAIALYRRAANLSGRTWDAPRLRLADLLSAQGHHEEARAEFEALVAVNPDHPRAHLGLAQIAAAGGEYAESLEHLDRCLASPLCRKKAHVLWATVLERQGKTAAAARAAELAEKSPPDANFPDPVLELVDEVSFGPMVIAGRASQILGQGRNRDAIGMLRGTALRYPDRDYIWLMLGQVLIKEGEYREAEEALERAVQLAPERAETRHYLGAALFAQRKYAAAADSFRQAIALQSDYEFAWYFLGESLRLQGDSAGAFKAYAAALRCRPNYASAHKRLGRLLAEAGKTKEAMAHLRHAVEFNLDPNDMEAKVWLEQLEKTGSLKGEE